MAEEGADIIAIDLCQPIKSVPYDLGTADDLAETARLVEKTGRRIITGKADVRDRASLDRVLAEGVAALGRLDIVSANAGICSYGSLDTMAEDVWQDMLDVNLTGPWHTAQAALPYLRAAGGGSIIITSSTSGLVAMPNIGHYVASKHGAVGLMKSLAIELAAERIRVNTLNPTNVNTPMLINDAAAALFAPDLQPHERTDEVMRERYAANQTMPLPYVECIDISNALLFLASDESRFVTGTALTVDAGYIAR
jgi:SDR family mycofactocin-dependent oxidoreductase